MTTLSFSRSLRFLSCRQDRFSLVAILARIASPFQDIAVLLADLRFYRIKPQRRVGDLQHIVLFLNLKRDTCRHTWQQF